MTLAPGQQLDAHLTLRERLGAGGLGEVWTAQHDRLGAEVAVKVLLQVAPSSEALARFQREARAVAQLGSPFTVQVFDFGVSPQGRPYIVMERLRGEDLHQRIERAGPMPVGEVSQVVEQVCSALDTAHRAGIVHRDIKPANVFLVGTGTGFHVKVLDFGIAKQLAEVAGEMTSTGAMLGTPYYMSPEQLMDPKRVGPASDLWSVAVMVYAALCGQLPFLGETVGALSVAIHKGHFTPPNVHRPDLPAALVHWMQRALSVEPADRYPSAVELARAFAQASAPSPSLASEPTAYANTAAASAGPLPSPPQPPAPLAPATTTSPVDRAIVTAAPKSGRPVGLYAALAVVSLVAAGAVGALVIRPGSTAGTTVSDDDTDAPQKKKKKRQRDSSDQDEEKQTTAPARSPERSPPADPASDPGMRVAGSDPLQLIKKLNQLAKDKRKDAVLVTIIFTDVPRNGILSNDASIVVVHFSPSINACIISMPVAGRAQVSEGSCMTKARRGIPLPRCSLATVRDRAAGSLPDVPAAINYMLGPGGKPAWHLAIETTGSMAVVTDDCP